jgi:hypothetical protein
MTRRYRPTRPTNERAMCYVAVKPCGCAIGAVAPHEARFSAGIVAGWVRKGYAIEQHRLEDARELLSPCPHDRPSQLELLGA